MNCDDCETTVFYQVFSRLVTISDNPSRVQLMEMSEKGTLASSKSDKTLTIRTVLDPGVSGGGRPESLAKSQIH